jgi:hypothetical protein
MSTHAIIGTPTPDGGFRGRYVHHDGFPHGVGKTFAAIIARDGLEYALRVLTRQYTSWSLLDEDLPAHADKIPFTVRHDVQVDGYGMAHHPDEPTTAEWYSDTGTTEAGAEWAYAATPESVQVWRRPTGGTWERRADLDIAYPVRETVWCEAHGGLEDPHFEEPGCVHPHFTDPWTRERVNAEHIRTGVPVTPAAGGGQRAQLLDLLAGRIEDAYARSRTGHVGDHAREIAALILDTPGITITKERAAYGRAV